MSESVLQELHRGAARFTAGDFSGALAICDNALKRAPNDAEALHLRAMTLAQLGRIDAAVAAYRAAGKVHPQKAAVFSNLGNALSGASRLEEAVDAYRQAIAHDPNFANAWSGLGATLDKIGAGEGAEEALREALRINPRHAVAHNNLGVIFHRRGRYEDAVAAFEAAMRADGGFVSAVMNRGMSLEKLGRLDAALNDYRQAAMQTPRSPAVQYQLAKALRAAGDFQGAIVAFRRAVASAPARADIQRDLAKLLWELGRTGDFLFEIDRAIAAAPAPALLLLRAELSLLANDIAGSRAAAMRLLSIAPDNVGALTLLAKIARADGDLGEATRLARSAYGADPADFAVRHAYAEALLVAGAYEEAAAVLDCEAPAEHLQRHIGMRALAWRALGDPRYKIYYDYDRFAAKLFIDPPSGFASLEAFNAALEAALRPLHSTSVRPLDQTLYGGTQSFGRLWQEQNPVIRALEGALLEAARRYIRGLPDDPGHPFLARKSEDLASAGSWSVILSAGGGHVDHIHPAGWVSATYYVRVPPEVKSGEKAGFLRLGGSGVAGLELPPERYFRPEEGSVIFFPSYIWHGVEPFESASPRIAAPFDLAPR